MMVIEVGWEGSGINILKLKSKLPPFKETLYFLVPSLTYIRSQDRDLLIKITPYGITTTKG